MNALDNSSGAFVIGLNLSDPAVMMWFMAQNHRVIQAYRYALDPTAVQEQRLRSHCGAQRFAFNWALSRVRANLAQRAAERTYGVDDQDLTPVRNWSAYDLRKQWNREKDQVASWWRENSKEAYASGVANLATGLANWSASKRGERRGVAMRFPRHKSRKAVMSCRFTTGAFGLVTGDRRHVKVPRVGAVRTWESTRKLARRIEAGSARIRSATVALRNNRWFVSFSVEVERQQAAPTRPTAVVGIDVGIKCLAVLSESVRGITDEKGMVANPRHLDHARKRMRRLQRQAARRRPRTGDFPSNRSLRTKGRIAHAHANVVNARVNGLHQLTAGITARFGTVVIEDLNIAGMLRNRCLARSIADTSWGELHRQLEYKVSWRGGRLVVADRWFPSSKLCSAPGCGAVKTKLRLGDRVYRCDQCGFVLDRDRNAARNLAALASKIDGASSPGYGATINEPDGNLCQTGIGSAVGTATGTPPGEVNAA